MDEHGDTNGETELLYLPYSYRQQKENHGILVVLYGPVGSTKYIDSIRGTIIVIILVLARKKVALGVGVRDAVKSVGSCAGKTSNKP